MQISHKTLKPLLTTVSHNYLSTCFSNMYLSISHPAATFYFIILLLFILAYYHRTEVAYSYWKHICLGV
jgi:hypothetical protein